ncbi:MAG TPA: RsmE family RNA methyltransferase [Thermoanaerobaculia bacterium]|nr:RsmE family RNA methyltransferase [Thermoanaerobaculia bacterium]
MITLLVTPEELTAAEVVVEGDAYRHLFRARRAAAGERLRVVDGRGRARWGTVAAVDRSAGTIGLAEAAPTHEPDRRVHLLVAAPKKERASWLVEKATELGVAAVRLIATERTPREFGDGTLRRLERVAAAALEQCHRSRLPELSGSHEWDEVPGLLAGIPAGRRWMLDTGEAAAGGEALRACAGEAAALLVGPEGGWTDGERQALAALGCEPVSLGPTVLRVETAALAGAALLLAR